jgi:L-fucose isomerase-like protein
MNIKKSTFALFFGNRGFFPATMISQAREELSQQLQIWGHKVLMMEEEATRFGAVETPAEGQKYADFLSANRGKYDGVILCLPNFGDETGAVTALKDAGVPILVQAYPDELDKMSPAFRRDAFCGKISIMDVFHQYGVKFTAIKPHVVPVLSSTFKDNVDCFDRVCRVIKGMENLVIGAIGARTTPFKTVRIDELALQKHGITVESFDLADIIGRVKLLSADSEAFKAKANFLNGYTTWDGIPVEAFNNLVRLGVVLDNVIVENKLNAIAIRCWTELQIQLGISPCVLLGALNNLGLPAACEVDIGNAIMMYALSMASGNVPACLDWNNNYGDDENKCILFHCGPVPVSLMSNLGHISDHAILSNSLGEGKSYGCHVGRISPRPFTFGSLLTSEGNIKLYLGQGHFTDDRIPEDFFGCAGVAEIPHLQEVLMHIGRDGHRHHVSITTGHVQYSLLEALQNYLSYEVTLPQMQNSI